MSAQYDGQKLAKIQRELNRLKNHEVVIGLISGVADSHIILIGTVNEYGAKIKVTPKMRGYLAYKGLYLKPTTQYITIPERSFMRSTVQNNKTKYKNMIEAGINDIIEHAADSTKKFKRIGFEVEKDIKISIRNIDKPPNHPFTIQQKKGADNPLIDTGKMRNSIAHKIRDRRL